ncbi:Transcriptional regulatory protein uhpA [Serratia fonticola]|uniref:helix-turn-helix transcriptional regulator n=1 Tax=Serratia fonticola TaxID=47917 RepID=UPI00217C9132|nr:helix-turn-helix transcriptional regulator [Serratia fonticola]CAI1805698.1 Transcriptional regulatory protein uhpA [Serratia fonticola]
MSEQGLGYHDVNDVSFHVASNNSFFIQGISCGLLKLKLQHEDIRLDYTLSDGSARSILLIADIIRDKHHAQLIVVIASAALLNMLSLSIGHLYRKRVIFIVASKCRAALLTQIACSPDNAWVKHEQYFPKGTQAALTNREKRVCYYLFRGYTPKMIGAILGINIKTVSSHRNSVMRKIGCANKIGLYKTLHYYYGAKAEG